MSGKWASDEAAGDLLAGILDETADDARAEEERLQREILAKADADSLAKEAANQARRAEAEAKISAEVERQSQSADRRTAKMEALRIEELKASGDWIDPAILAKKQRDAEELRRRDEAALAASIAASEAPAAQAAPEMRLPEPAPKSNTGLIIGLAFVLVAVIGGGVAIFVMNSQYKVDEQTYAKSVYSPKETEVAVVEKAFTPIPKAAPVLAADDEKPATSRRRSRRSRGSKKSTKKAKKTDKTGAKANKKAAELEKMLDSSDPFSAF